MALVRTDVEYFIVDSLVPSYKELTREMYHHHQSGYSGYWELEIELLQERVTSPLHVGTGEYELAPNGYYQPSSRFNGKLLLSGSSIKGAVRSYAEALSPSCEGGICRQQGTMCPSCLLFGRVSGRFGHMGRISFSDSFLDENVSTTLVEVPLRWGGKLTDGRRFYWHSNYKTWLSFKNFDGEQPDGEQLEVILPPAVFKTRLYFNNATGEELGLILLAMGAAPDREFFLKLGGGKNRGLGSVKFKVGQQFLVAGAAGVGHTGFPVHGNEGPDRLEPSPGRAADAYSTYDLETNNLTEQEKNQEKNSWVESYLEILTAEQKDVVLSNLEVFGSAFLEDANIEQEFGEKLEKNKDKGFKM